VKTEKSGEHECVRSSLRDVRAEMWIAIDAGGGRPLGPTGDILHDVATTEEEP